MFGWFKRKREPQPPTVTRQSVGTLRVHSGVVWVGDPMFVINEVVIEDVPAGNYPVVADILRYPEGGQRVARVEVTFAAGEGQPELLGELGVDSASVAALDARTHEQFWQAPGQERLGVLGTPQHRKVAKLLKIRFGLESRPVNSVRSELMEPVSVELEQEITAYLEGIPEYAEFPFMFFRIDTKDAGQQLQDRLREHGLWCEMVLDESSGANVLAFQSGFGDGRYPVHGVRHNGRVIRTVVEFIGPKDEAVLEPSPLLRY